MKFDYKSFIVILYSIIFGRSDALQHSQISTKNRIFQSPYRLILVDSWSTTVRMAQEEVRFDLKCTFY